jgi:hypothetical protein
VERIVYAAIPFVVAGALIIASIHFATFTTDTESLGSSSGVDEIMLPPNQTYMYNVTIAYMEFPIGIGPGILNENNSIVVQEYVIKDTLTSWTRVWLPIDISLNGKVGADCLINETIERPNGVIEAGPYSANVEGGTGSIGTGFIPEMTQGGTVRLALENLGSADANLSVNWETDFHLFDKPYFYYGIIGLAIGLLYPAAFLIKQVDARHRQRAL